MQSVPLEGSVVPKVVTALGKSPMFSGVKPDSLSQISVRGELLRYDAGEVAVEAGTPSDAFFFVMTTQKGIGNRVLSEELAKLVKERVVDHEDALARAADKPELARLCGQPVPKV